MTNLEVAVITAGAMSVLFFIILALVIRFKKPYSHDGFMDVVANDTRLIFQLELETEPKRMQNQKYVVLKVRKMAKPGESQA